MNLPSSTFLIISLSVLPLNGGYPLSIIYNITPQDQRSHFSSYLPLRTSGAI